MGSPYVPFKGPTIAGFGGALMAIDFNQKERVAVDCCRCRDAQLARRFVVAVHVCRRVDAEVRASAWAAGDFRDTLDNDDQRHQEGKMVSELISPERFA